MSNRGLANKEQRSRGTHGWHGRMGRERGCVCDRETPRDLRGLYGWEIEGGACAKKDAPREIEIDHAHVCDGD